jgi:hypothetical protein
MKKQRLIFKVGPENAKYTDQHAIDVSDMAGHQLRIFEIKRTFPTNPPLFDGVPVVTMWTRGFSDYIDESGSGLLYGTYDLESGDKIFVRSTLVAQRSSGGAGNSTSSTAGVLSGGTGKFAGIEGTAKSTTQFNPGSGFNQTDFEIEYWMEEKTQSAT